MDLTKNISLVDIGTLDEKSRISAGYLVMESLPAYYKVEGTDETVMATAVAAMLGTPGSEVERGFAALCSNEVVGILTFLCVELLASARLAGAQILLKRLPGDSAARFLDNLRHYDASYGIVPDKSLYLSRFAIDRNYRGSGLASQMMGMFLSLNKDFGEEQAKYSLHVNRENDRAIAFYRKHGFVLYDSETRYLTMIWSLGNS